MKTINRGYDGLIRPGGNERKKPPEINRVPYRPSSVTGRGYESGKKKETGGTWKRWVVAGLLTAALTIGGGVAAVKTGAAERLLNGPPVGTPTAMVPETGAAESSPVSEKAEEIVWDMPSKEPTSQELIAQRAEETQKILGAEIYINGGVPFAYRQADGKIVELSQGEIDKIEEAQTKARESGQSQLAIVIRQGREVESDGRVKPELWEWSAETVDSEELEQRQIKIVTPEGLELRLRRAAFEEGGYFEQLTKGRFGAGLDIVVVPNSKLELPDDPRYEPYRKFVESREAEINKYRTEEYEKLKQTVQQGGQAGLWAEIELEVIKKMTDSELLVYMQQNQSADKKIDPAGIYFSPREIQDGRYASVIFVGWEESGNKGYIIPIIVDSSGNYQATFDFNGGYIPGGLETGQLCSQENMPRSHRTSAIRKPYLIEDVDTGVIMAHEAGHFRWYWGGDTRWKNETEVDRQVLGYHERAGKTLDESGGTDMHQYQFEWRLPSGQIVVN